MARTLLIAEKPALMRAIQAVYNKMSMSDTIDFMAFVGHTMTLAEPKDYKAEWGDKWNIGMLPIVPDNFKCKVASGKSDLYNQIKNKITTGHYDYLINACDPDREGQAIFQYFVDHVGCKLPVKRFWTNDISDVNVKNALTNLRDNNEPKLKRLTTASMLRSKFDWLVGMNLTVACSLKMNTLAKVGRVKTPTLKLIVDRELEILNFKPTTTYELEGIFDKYSGTYIDQDGIVRFKTKLEADKIIKDLSKDCFIESIEEKTETVNAPQLYTLSTLQTEASKLHGYNAEQTKSIVQSLYEKKILSYPRTDCPYISSALAGNFPDMLKAVATIPDVTKEANSMMNDKKAHQQVVKNKRYVNDAKMAEAGHYAITPTGAIPTFSLMSVDEKNIFTMVGKRFLAIFLPPMKVAKTIMITNSNGHLFRTTGKKLISKGFSEIYNSNMTDVMLPPLKKGDKVSLNETKINEKITTPPQRYTDGTLISAMENPGKFLHDDSLKTTLKESKGIGTTATRDGIITELVNNKYIERKKAKGKIEYIFPTAMGISIIENLKDMDISSVDLTGIWEDKLSKVEKGEINEKEFSTEMISYVLKSIDDVNKSSMGKVYANSKTEVVGTCPICGKPVKEGKDYYLCSGYKKDCDFIVGKTLLGAKISNADIKKILAGQPTKELKFKKADKEWSAKLIFDKAQKKLAFMKGNAGSTDLGKCPVCGKPVKNTGKYYVCSEYKNPCTFILNSSFMGAKITEADMKKLLTGKSIKKEFTWKSGKKSEANLLLENGKPKFDFN